MALYSFQRYPYSNFHEMNMDWILQTLNELVTQMDGFVDLNTLKVADPIAWNQALSYERLTVVTATTAQGLTAYLSITEVPANIAITNTGYWARIGVIIDNTSISAYLQAITDQVDAKMNDVDDKLTECDNKIAEVDDALADIDSDFSDFQTTITNSVNSQLSAFETTIDAKLPQNLHNYTTFYLDGVSGDDDNDGLSRATALKTLDKAIELGNQYSMVHLVITSAGTYNCLYSEISGISLDITGEVNGITLYFTPDTTSGRYIFYNGRLHLESIAANKMTIRTAVGSTLWFIDCATSMVNVDVLNDIHVYGGELWIDASQAVRIFTRNIFFRLRDTVITNTESSQAISLVSSVSYLTGTSTAIADNANGASTAAIIVQGGLFTTAGNMTSLINAGSGYLYGLQLTDSIGQLNNSMQTVLANGGSGGVVKLTNAYLLTSTSN